jgi:hypothetical protein
MKKLTFEYGTPEYDNLLQKEKAKWDKKLAAEDKSLADCDENNVKARIGMADLRLKTALVEQPDMVEATRAYFNSAEGFLYVHKWKNQTERNMWKLHSEGKGQGEIATILMIATKEDLTAAGAKQRVRVFIGVHQKLAGLKPPPHQSIKNKNSKS